MEAAGIELENEAFANLVTLRDFGRIGFGNQDLPPGPEFAPVLPSPPESPLGVEVFWRRRGEFPPPRGHCCPRENRITSAGPFGNGLLVLQPTYLKRNDGAYPGC